MSQDVMLTYEQAARVLGVSRSTLLRIINKDGLPVVRIGTRNPRIRQSDLEAYIERQSS